MESNIPTGSVIGVQSVDGKEDTKKGMSLPITVMISWFPHRIDEVKNDGKTFITQGDNNNAPDSAPVTRQNIVRFHSGITIPYVGYATHFANTNEGRALLFIILDLVLISSAVYIIWRAIHQIKRPKQTNDNRQWRLSISSLLHSRPYEGRHFLYPTYSS